MKIIASFALVFLLSDIGRAGDVPLDVRESYLKFTGHAFMHDFNGEAKEFSGTAQMDSQKPEMVVGAKIDIQAPKMTTFESARDQNMFNWLHVDVNPTISFQLKSVKLVQGDPNTATKDHPAQFTVDGDFTLNKTTKPLETQAQSWREGKWLVVIGTTKVDTTEYGLPIISQYFMTVDKSVDISFRLVFDLPPGLQVPPVH